MKITKRLFASLACALLLCGLFAPAYADGSYEYTLKPSSGGEGCSFTITIDGLESVVMDEYYDDYLGITARTSAELERGSTIYVRIDWIAKHARDVRISYVNNVTGKYEYTDEYRRGVVVVVYEGQETDYDDFTSPWTQLISSSDDSVEFYITAPDDNEITSITIGASNDLPSYSYVYAIDISLPVDENTQTVTHTAAPDSGEDEGTVIRPDIVETPKPSSSGGTTSGRDDGTSTAAKVALSVGGAVVAGAVALGGRSGKKNGAEEDEKKRKTYKMKVFKNFGDGLRRGAKPVPVWARIVEVVDGHERNRPDLSERITASGEGMTVSLAGIQNTYQTAMVSVPMDSAAAKAALVFTFAGDGGVFRNRISFRVLGEPRIVFPRLTEDGTGWVMNADLDTVRMVAGMGGTARLRFVIADADEEPVDITFGKADGFSVKRVKDTELAFTYWAEITNRTLPMEKENGVFAEPENRDITIRAEFADGSAAENAFRVELWPDGISVPAKDARDGALEVDTRPDERAGEGFAERKPAGFEVYVCYTDTDGAAVILENPTLRFGRLDDGGKYGLTFQENFEYDLSRTGSAGFLLFPKVTLPVLRDPYEAKMTISYEGVKPSRAELPMRFLGETPTRPSSAEWNAAYERLKKSVTYFGIGDEPALRTLIRHAEKHSAAELESIRCLVIQAGVAFYRRQLLEYQGFDQLCSRYLVVAGSFVKVGDLAVELAMTKWFGGYGKLAGKFMNPLKNMLAAYAGQFIGPGSEWDGRYEDMPFLKTLLQSCDEALAAAITGTLISGDLTDPTNITASIGKYALKISGTASDEIRDAIGYVIAAYLMVCFTEHYYGMKGDKSARGDFYRSALAAIKDLGYESLKAWVLKRVEKVAKPLVEKVGALCGSIYKGFCQSKINEAALKAGQKVMEDGLRRGLQYDGYMITMSNAAYRTAKSAQDYAIKETIRIHNEYLDKQIAAFVKMLGDTAENVSQTDTNGILVGQVLNYFAGRNAEDGSQALGIDAKEVGFELIAGWLSRTLGVIPDRVVAASGAAADALQVDMYIEGDRIIMELLGYQAEIPILSNLPALCDLMLDWLLSWLESIWETIKMPFDPSGAPDPRDQVETDADRIEADLETQKRKVENAEWQYKGDKNNT